MEIWLIRHGETEWSKSGQHTGRMDLELTPKGVEEAEAVKALLDGRKFDRVLSSPLKRARQTCEIAGYGDVAEYRVELMEWNYGDIEGRRSVDVRKEMPDWNVWKGPLPNGETLEQVRSRADRVVDELKDAEGEIVIFAHGHFLRIFTTAWLELDPEAAKHFVLETATISILGHDHGFRAVLRWNQKG